MEPNYPQQLPFPFDLQPKVLVADDDRDSRATLERFLTDRGCSVTTVATGPEALAMVDRHPDLDVVLLDVVIPGIGGLEVLSKITKRDRSPGVILVTALADREIAGDALRLGAFTYIIKPLDLSEVESSLVACLAHSEYRNRSWWKRIFQPAA